MSRAEQLDLIELLGGAALTPAQKRSLFRRSTQPKGYAKLPGSGPKGETCKSCEHCTRIGGYSKTFYKCLLIQQRWTGGRGTDILIRASACSLWKAKTNPPSPG